MSISIINRYVQLLADAFHALGEPIDLTELELLATIVHNAMENNRRHYHNSKHVFDLCQDMSPVQTISAVFHDVVYYQIDGDYPLLAKPYLEDVIELDTQNNVMLLSAFAQQDALVKLCADIFGFKVKQSLSVFAGFNEFLSAVLACRLLHKHLDTAQLIQVVTCIEATIPFRGNSPDGTNCMQQLAHRLKTVCQQKQLFDQASQLDSFIRETMQHAVLFSNQDVAGFAEANPAEFLSATWQLIDESNAPLKPVNFYTLQQYRIALGRMEKFLSTLDYKRIFHHYEDVPGKSMLAKYESNAQNNLSFASQYIRAKICSVAIVEAIALETGGDCPISLFLGDIRCYDGIPDRIEKFLPSKIQHHPELNEVLLNILVGGRSKDSKNDLTASPLTAYFYQIVGHSGLISTFEYAEQMFSQQLTPIQFLQLCDKFLVQSIIQGCKKIAISRANKLDDLLAKLN